MATTYTENYGLGKQEEKSDKFDMSVITKNMDKLDKVLYEAKEDTATHTSNTTAHITAEEREKWDGASELAVLNRQTLGTGCKNLLKNTATSTTKSGITFTVNDDKSITVSGTATANADLEIAMDAPTIGDYILTGCPSGGGTDAYWIRAYYTVDGSTAYNIINTDTGSGCDVKITATMARFIARIRVYSGQTVDGLTFYPMLRDARISDATYVPYQPSVEERLATLEADTGWIDCISNATADSIAFDESYTQVAKIRRVGKYVSFRGTFKFVSDGTGTSDTYVRAFVRSVIPSGCRPSETIYATQFYGVYASSTSATYTPFSCNVTTDGAITLYMNEGAKITEIYGKVVRINMDWLIG